jgi:hypothetical protein
MHHHMHKKKTPNFAAGWLVLFVLCLACVHPTVSSSSSHHLAYLRCIESERERIFPCMLRGRERDKTFEEQLEREDERKRHVSRHAICVHFPIFSPLSLHFVWRLQRHGRYTCVLYIRCPVRTCSKNPLRFINHVRILLQRGLYYREPN